MSKIKECPDCKYPMDKVFIRKGGTYVARIENYVCASCHHKERVSGTCEYARACRKTEIETDNLEFEDD